MTDRPILFSAPMVRALLAGMKTQTRRIIKPQPPEGVVRHCWYDAPLYGFTRDHDVSSDWHVARLLAYKGDCLWVREAWRCNGWATDVATIFYAASEGDGYTAMCEKYPVADKRPLRVTTGWRPSIHMPRWASRLTLTVTDVRIERLQDISEADARAEGCPVSWDGKPYAPPPPEVDSWQGYGRASFCLLWSKINGPGSWEANPWVAAYTFTVQIQNIDQIARAA